MTQASAHEIKERLVNVVEELSPDRAAEILDFALFVKSRHEEQSSRKDVQPVQRLEDLWGDFWPESESVDDFVDAVRRWRRENLDLHKDLE